MERRGVENIRPREVRSGLSSEDQECAGCAAVQNQGGRVERGWNVADEAEKFGEKGVANPVELEASPGGTLLESLFQLSMSDAETEVLHSLPENVLSHVEQKLEMVA